MAGILDKKTRFIDLVITQEGKRQIANGKLKAEFASANDSQADYQKSEHYEDAVKKIYFETMERPENSITLEVDDSGRLVQFDLSPTGSIVGDKIFQQGTFGETQEDVVLLKLMTGSQFASLFDNLPKNVLNNFSKNYFISSLDSVNINNEFEISKERINFRITDTVPFANGTKQEVINVNDADPFFLDKKLTHLPNFDFLPPVNENGTPYGIYEDFRSTQNLSWQNIIDELGALAFRQGVGESNNLFQESATFIAPSAHDSNSLAAAMGDGGTIDASTTATSAPFFGGNPNNPTVTFSPNSNLLNNQLKIIKPFEIINFTKTSQNNNLLIQIFESFNDSIKKLDIIDGGIFLDEDDPDGNFEKHVFYVGKVYFDDLNVPTFINLYTLVFE